MCIGFFVLFDFFVRPRRYFFSAPTSRTRSDTKGPRWQRDRKKNSDSPHAVENRRVGRGRGKHKNVLVGIRAMRLRRGVKGHDRCWCICYYAHEYHKTNINANNISFAFIYGTSVIAISNLSYIFSMKTLIEIKIQ